MVEKSINILLVDDDRDYSEIMGFWLKSKGHIVKSVSNGKEALEVLKEKNPDIVLLDIDMPEMDGMETLRHIREMNKEVPVIMVTAHGGQERIKKAESLGASGFFNKATDFSVAAALIQKTLKKLDK